MGEPKKLPLAPGSLEIAANGLPLPPSVQLVAVTVRTGASGAAASFEILDTAALQFPLANSGLFEPGPLIEVSAGHHEDLTLLFFRRGCRLAPRDRPRVRTPPDRRMPRRCRLGSLGSNNWAGVRRGHLGFPVGSSA